MKVFRILMGIMKLICKSKMFLSERKVCVSPSQNGFRQEEERVNHSTSFYDTILTGFDLVNWQRRVKEVCVVIMIVLSCFLRRF